MEAKKFGGKFLNKRTPVSVSEACLRLYCQPVNSSTLQGQRHNQQAKVGHMKLQAASGAKFLIDGRSSNARVRNFEVALLILIKIALIEYADDHAKWKPDTKKAFTAKATLMVTCDRKSAPYQDMKPPVPGLHGVTSSHLFVMPVEPSQAGTAEERVKRGFLCQKEAVAVSRLLYDRPSTATQQVNDSMYAISAVPRLRCFVRDQCMLKGKVTDGGSDQNPRHFEVQFADTYEHLVSGRLYDGHFCRCGGLSIYNEAEHVNGEETSAVSKAEVPSMVARSTPTNAAEIKSNGRSMMRAIANSISGGTYAGKPLTSLLSHPDLGGDDASASETITPELRLAARSINDCGDKTDKTKMPLARKVLPVLTYMDLHSCKGHYSFQLCRGACELKLGRRCQKVDYGRGEDDIGFEPCDAGGAWNETKLEWTYFIPDAKRKADGHYETWAEVRAEVLAGRRESTFQEEPPSLEMKRFYKEESTIPSDSELERLATKVYGDGSKQGILEVEMWFEQRRLEDLLKVEEKRKAANEASRDGHLDLEGVVTKLINACAPKITGITPSAKSLRSRCVALIKSPELGGTVSSQGSTVDVVKRVYSIRECVLTAFKVDPGVLHTPLPEEEENMCHVCLKPSSSTADPLLECVAQCDGKYCHMRCANLDHIPTKDWLCEGCTKSGVFVVRYITDKLIAKRGTSYKVTWLNHEMEAPTWQLSRDIPPGSRGLVNAYNARLRAERKDVTGSEGGEQSSSHVLVGSKIAKNFGDGIVFSGYVTRHYAGELNERTSVLSEELFHVEYDDGDEEDMNLNEVNAGIALASGHS